MARSGSALHLLEQRFIFYVSLQNSTGTKRPCRGALWKQCLCCCGSRPDLSPFVWFTEYMTCVDRGEDRGGGRGPSWDPTVASQVASRGNIKLEPCPSQDGYFGTEAESSGHRGAACLQGQPQDEILLLARSSETWLVYSQEWSLKRSLTV